MKQLIRFLLVGAFNTGFGYCIIFFCMYVLKISPEESNVIGYAIALGVSYALNRRITFESNEKRTGEILKFLLVFLFAYSANLLALIFLFRVLHLEKGVSQVLAGIFYVCVSFLLNKYYVFKAPISE
ncbi:GtrA family protein [Paraburkholderia caribensis]|uniref:GtrA family protein n=1 Tax=Paraburkholderia caribensis TaxID=75105 RepID=A0ABV0DQN4_9BURK|nr:GtrA family protein [Paraburkholderia caribensis]MCO4876538.1 GtrA family protein [Paraburkholderia caribensis]